MNKHYQSGLDDEHDRIHSDFDEAERFAKALAFVIVFAFLCVVGLWCATASAQMPTFTATRTTGEFPISTTLTWNVSGAVTCVAGSTPGWSGLVPTSGTRNLSGINVDMRLTLDCKGPDGTGVATLSWTPPTHHTNGTPLTDLAGYRIEYGTVAPGSAGPTFDRRIELTNAALRAHRIENLTPGEWAFRVLAVDSEGHVSEPSNVATKTIAASPGAALPQLSISIDGHTRPNPPTELTVTSDAQAYDIRPDSTGKLLAQRVGLVKPGTVCDATNQRTVGAVTYSAVPREFVDMANFSNGPDKWVATVYAKCS